MKLLAVIFLFVISLNAQVTDSVTKHILADSANRALDNRNQNLMFHAADLEKFYVGYSKSEGYQNLITLQITSLDSTKEQLNFQYRLNGIDSREDGEGTIQLSEGIINLGLNKRGRIQKEENGRICLESIPGDSLNYWKLKEVE